MLISYAKFRELRVLSLQIGGPVAMIDRLIVDPHDLKIIALGLIGPTIGNGEVGDILDARSIREISKLGLIIDSTDELVEAADVIKIRDIMQLNFNPIGMRVITKRGTKLGKVSDYTMNTDNLMIQQLVVQRPPLRAILDPELIIGRSEITEITDHEIIIKDEEKTLKAKAAADPDFIPNFVNPFRERPDFAPADSQNPGA